MSKVIWVNQDAKGSVEAKGHEYMEATKEAIQVWADNGYDFCCPNHGRFYEYASAFVPVLNEEEDGVLYYSYQISGGGPSDELRFYPDRVEYVYLNWFCGVGFDVTGEEWAEFVRSEFEYAMTFEMEDEEEY